MPEKRSINRRVKSSTAHASEINFNEVEYTVRVREVES